MPLAQYSFLPIPSKINLLKNPWGFFCTIHDDCHVPLYSILVNIHIIIPNLRSTSLNIKPINHSDVLLLPLLRSLYDLRKRNINIWGNWIHSHSVDQFFCTHYVFFAIHHFETYNIIEILSLGEFIIIEKDIHSYFLFCTIVYSYIWEKEFQSIATIYIYLGYSNFAISNLNSFHIPQYYNIMCILSFAIEKTRGHITHS